VVRTVNFSNNLTNKVKPFYNQVKEGMESHIVSMAVAAGADVESTLDNVAAGDPPSFMYVKDFHAGTIGSVYSKEMGLPAGFAYREGMDKEEVSELNDKYHKFAKGEAAKAIESIEASFDADYQASVTPGA
jgi:hypothetical protein